MQQLPPAILSSQQDRPSVPQRLVGKPRVRTLPLCCWQRFRSRLQQDQWAVPVQGEAWPQTDGGHASPTPTSGAEPREPAVRAGARAHTRTHQCVCKHTHVYLDTHTS